MDFKNTIVIMTSNIGSTYLIDNIRQDGTIDEEVKKQVEDEMKRHFRPEFINRIDDIVVFSPLTESQITQIIDIAIKGLVARLAEREITLTLTDEAKRFIASESYTPAYGARPVKRYLQKHVETELASKLIKGEISDGDHVVVDVRDGALDFRRE